MVGYDRRKFAFPLRAESLEQGDSLEYPQIHISDICAGAINYYLKFREINPKDDLIKLIEAMNLLDWITGVVIPSTDFTPEELGADANDGINSINLIVEHFRRRRNAKS